MSKITALNLNREYIVIDGTHLYVLVDDKWTPVEIPKVNNEQPKKWDSTLFDTFWKKYPKSYGKQQALKIWKSSGCDEHFDEIMKGLDVWDKSDNWSNRIYVTNCAKWLRDKMYSEPPQKKEQFQSENCTNYRKKFLDKIES